MKLPVQRLGMTRYCVYFYRNNLLYLVRIWCISFNLFCFNLMGILKVKYCHLAADFSLVSIYYFWIELYPWSEKEQTTKLRYSTISNFLWWLATLAYYVFLELHLPYVYTYVPTFLMSCNVSYNIQKQKCQK